MLGSDGPLQNWLGETTRALLTTCARLHDEFRDSGVGRGCWIPIVAYSHPGKRIAVVAQTDELVKPVRWESHIWLRRNSVRVGSSFGSKPVARH